LAKKLKEDGTTKQIAKKYNVSKATISEILKNNPWMPRDD